MLAVRVPVRAASRGDRVRIGSLFSGYGGLDLAVETVLEARTVWHVENNPAAARILAHHWPGVPNYGDITAVDWASVEPVDIVAGGFPCQDVSAAGRRVGLRPGTRSGLWTHMAYAVAALRPRIVVVENVRGVLSAEAHSDMEPCPHCLGDRPNRAPLRALGAVLGDLARLGYDARWCGLRAADVGAPHGRFRVFVVAADTRSETSPLRAGLRASQPVGIGRRRPDHCGRPAVADADQQGPQGTQPAQRRDLPARGAAADTDHAGRVEHGGASAASPEHAAAQHRRGTAADPASERRHEGQPEPTRLVGRPDAAERSVATAADTDRDRLESLGRELAGQRDSDRRRRTDVAWGRYEPAIRRWERIVGRPAPAPTVGRRLNAAFVEWMMGLPDGWVTAVPHDPDTMLPGLPADVAAAPALTRVDMLTALGNGVVPQQAAEALRVLLDGALGEDHRAHHVVGG
jgi:DNA (cytosine-5)-methyltransferase 1